MSLLEITEYEMRTQGVASLPARPNSPREFGGRGYTPDEIKAAFDRLPRLVAERYNDLIAYIKDGSYLAEIPYDENTTLRGYMEWLSARLNMQYDDMTELMLSMEAAEQSLSEQSGTLTTQEGITEGHRTRIEALERDTALLRSLLMNSTVAVAGTEDTFVTRITAGGMHVLDHVVTEVTRIDGATAVYGDEIRHASFAGICSTGKNMIDLSVYAGHVGNTGSGVTITADNNTLTIVSDSNGIISGFIDIPESYFEDGETYTFYQTPVFGTDGTSYRNRDCVQWYIESWDRETNVKQQNVYTSFAPGYQSVTFDKSRFTYKICITRGTFTYPQGEVLNSTVSFMCFRGAPAQGDTVAYEPYRDDTTLTLASPITLGKWDYIDLARGKVVRETATVVFDGTETWARLSTKNDKNRFYTSLPTPSCTMAVSAVRDFVATQYGTQSQDDTYLEYTGASMSGDGTEFTIYDAQYAESDVETWRAHVRELYVAGTPLTVSYRMLGRAEEDILLPATGYTAWCGGTETILSGTEEDTPLCTVSQNYYVRYDGEVTA